MFDRFKRVASGSGIVARSDKSLFVDGLFGVALPILLIGISMFVIVTPDREDQKTKPN